MHMLRNGDKSPLSCICSMEDCVFTFCAFVVLECRMKCLDCDELEVETVHALASVRHYSTVIVRLKRHSN